MRDGFTAIEALQELKAVEGQICVEASDDHERLLFLAMRCLQDVNIWGDQSPEELPQRLEKIIDKFDALFGETT